MPKQSRTLPDIESLLAGGFNEETARQVYAQGGEVAIFVMMQFAAMAKKTVEANDVHPSHPSASVAVFLKQPRNKPGRRPGTTRKRYVEDIPDAMPGAMIGHRVVAISAFLHYAVGITISRIVEIFVIL